MKQLVLHLAGAVMLAFSVTPVLSAANATVNVIHGIPDLPVTVCVNGAAAIPQFNYTDIVTVPLPAGTYTVAVLPGFNADCGGAAALGPVDLTFDARKNYTVIAHLTANGEPAASVFLNDLSAARPGNARVVVHHTAAAPAVYAKIGRPTPSALDIVTPAFANVTEEGSETPISAQIRPGDWQVLLFPEGSSSPVFGPVPVKLAPKTSYLVYAVGALDNQFTLLVLPVALPVR